MKTSDIPDELVLRHLAKHQGEWSMLFDTKFVTSGEDYTEAMARPSIFPEGTNHKLALSKMRSLHKRGLVGGCPCGCRGDFEITDKGLALINEKRTAEYSGY